MDAAHPSLRRCGVTDDGGVDAAGEEASERVAAAGDGRRRAGASIREEKK